MNKKLVIIYIGINSPHFNTRRMVEDSFCGKTFKDIESIKEYCKELQLEYRGCDTIDEHINCLNDEEYPTEEWCGYCYIETD